MEKVVKEKYQLVTDLDLEGNRIGLTGIDHLARAGWSELRVISLSTSVGTQTATTSKTRG